MEVIFLIRCCLAISWHIGVLTGRGTEEKRYRVLLRVCRDQKVTSILQWTHEPPHKEELSDPIPCTSIVATERLLEFDLRQFCLSS